MKLIQVFLSSFLIIFCSYPFIFAEEQITIATYYPSPYGSYSRLQADKLGVGDVNGNGSSASDDIPTTSGDVWIKGNLGIGTINTPHKLTISSGDVLIKNSSGYPAYYLYKGDSGLTNKYFGIGFTDSRFSFFNDNDGSYPWLNEYMIIDGATGNVGIGTTSPYAKVSVVNNTAEGHLGYAGIELLGHAGYTTKGVIGKNTATGADDWAGYFAGKLYVNGNIIIQGNLSANSASINDWGRLDVVSSSLSTSSLKLSGVTITSWPAMTCRVVIASASGENSANAVCANDEYLTGGGCYWQDIAAGALSYDNVYMGNLTATSGSGTSLGLSYKCAANANGNKTARAICCKLSY